VTRPKAKNATCIVCGAPADRPGVRCSPCSASARAERSKRHMRLYHAAHRPSPSPIPQPDPRLPPLGVLIYDDDGARVQCHVCGELFGSLVHHVRIHGYDAARYKAAFGLARGASLLSPATAAKQRAAALARDQGEIGRRALAALDAKPRPAGIPLRLSSRITMSQHSAKRSATEPRTEEPA
jgi:hypothetical protein